ncbi:MAG TPA: DUF2189 domain-containing protein [Rhodopila sp.]|nr:DUF2189 domain-containing protein [Rhodopila sp.]
MIKTPPGWGVDVLSHACQSWTRVRPDQSPRRAAPADVQRIGVADLRWALERGVADFGASRTDVMFLCLVYPLVGLLLGRMASGYEMLPLVFPLASGFALLGPLAAIGMNELSRRRALGLSAGWADAFGVFRSPAIGRIAVLGAVLIVMFLFWLVLSNAIYNLTLGPNPPVSAGQFVHDVAATRAGRMMALAGIGIGFVFAVVAGSISVVSFPMLLDRNVSLEVAVRTSLRVVARNPVTMAMWGLIVAAGLLVGSIPLLLGLVVVMPVLGHATWHLYRLAVRW